MLNSKEMKISLSLDQSMNKKLWNIYYMEYYSTIALELMMLSKISQSKKDKCHIISLTCKIQKIKLTPRKSGYQRLGQVSVAVWESYSMRTKLQLDNNKKFQNVIPP